LERSSDLNLQCVAPGTPGLERKKARHEGAKDTKSALPATPPLDDGRLAAPKARSPRS
jgi:hypothetical protein